MRSATPSTFTSCGWLLARAGAALDIFAICLPPKVYRTARKALRGLRRAAGEAP